MYIQAVSDVQYYYTQRRVVRWLVSSREQQKKKPSDVHMVRKRKLSPMEQAKSIDQYVGMRIRMARAGAEISQTHLAEQLGLSFQQLQKYERAINRIGAGRLLLVARALNVPITFFYDGLKMEKSNAEQEKRQFINLAELSPVKSACIETITRADDKNVSPVYTLLERLSGTALSSSNKDSKD